MFLNTYTTVMFWFFAAIFLVSRELEAPREQAEERPAMQLAPPLPPARV